MVTGTLTLTQRPTFREERLQKHVLTLEHRLWQVTEQEVVVLVQKAIHLVRHLHTKSPTRPAPTNTRMEQRIKVKHPFHLPYDYLLTPPPPPTSPLLQLKSLSPSPTEKPWLQQVKVTSKIKTTSADVNIYSIISLWSGLVVRMWQRAIQKWD